MRLLLLAAYTGDLCAALSLCACVPQFAFALYSTGGSGDLIVATALRPPLCAIQDLTYETRPSSSKGLVLYGYYCSGRLGRPMQHSARTWSFFWNYLQDKLSFKFYRVTFPHWSTRSLQKYPAISFSTHLTSASLLYCLLLKYLMSNWTKNYEVSRSDIHMFKVIHVVHFYKEKHILLIVLKHCRQKIYFYYFENKNTLIRK